MKRFKFLSVLLVLVMEFSLCACNGANDSGGTNVFGTFGYNGVTLVDYAVRSISAQKAKEILPLSTRQASGYSVQKGLQNTSQATTMSIKNVIGSSTQDDVEVNQVVRSILSKYAGCVVTTKYYLENTTDVQSKTDKIIGTDFRYFLIDNEFIPFNQLVAKNVVAYDELIDFMEEENRRFQQSDLGLIAPFKNIFSYHTGEDGNLIIQSRDFAEIASSVGGGVGCSYRQDTQIVYDKEGKMTLWQTSLGISSSAPQGTMSQGYILEIHVEWLLKV